MTARYNEVDVSLVSGDVADQVQLTFISADGKTLVLTPAQARALASDLITAVNRAEVKNRLKSVPSMWERSRPASLALAA